MLQTVVDAARLFKQLEDYNQKHATKILESDIEGCDLSEVALVMSIHDFYKPKQSSGHAEKGADFLDDVVIGLVRHHDKFGIQHTGEASILALDTVVQWLGTLNAESRRRALAMLPVITILDSGAVGYLDQPRVETYFHLKSNLQSVLNGKTTLEELAEADTAARIQRLIQSNNRATIDIALVESALQETPTLKEHLPRIRFDAGASVFEPLMLYLIDEKYDFPAPPAARRIGIGPQHRPALVRLLQELNRMATEAAATGKNTVDLGHMSLKPGANMETRRAAFEKWAATV